MAFSIDSRRVFIVLSVAVAVSLPFLSFDFGITEDEQLHAQHGKSILDYFLGRNELAARHPLDASGKLTFDYGPDMRDLSGALNIYGGFFDLLCAATQRYLSPLGEFEHRHFVNSLFGALLIVFGGLTAREIAGWRAGVLALLLLACCPRIIGHSMNNPVDLPFAALYLFCFYFILRFVEQLPRPGVGVWVALLIGIPLATNVRIAGLVLLCYLGLFVSVWHWPGTLEQRAIRGFVRSLGLTLLLGTGAYLLVSAPWPLAHRDPLGTPLMALRHLSRLETFEALDLFEGRWIARLDIPWYFVPKWFLIGSPLFVPLGAVLGSLPFWARFASSGNGRTAIDRRKAWMLLFACLFPVVFVILRRSNVYNDARHVLFALPPLVVLGAVGFECLLRWVKGPVAKAVVVVILAGTMVEPLAFMIRNHPNEVVYFSPWVGGIDGAWQRFETDYWGNSVRQAVEWIHENVVPEAGRPVRVRIWYGDQTKAAYYVEKKPGFEHVVVPEESSDWDYRIAMTVQAKHEPRVLTRWPPPATVYEVLADGTPLCAVVMNHRGAEPEGLLRATRDWVDPRPTHARLYALGTTAYLVGRFEDAVDVFTRAVELQPDDAESWSALGSAQGRMQRWDEQIAASKMALQVDPELEAARFNLRYALEQRNASRAGDDSDALSHDEHVARSLSLYDAGRFAESAEECIMALRKNPVSAVAHNNLCAAYNALRDWKAARAACETALALVPDFPRARNNLSVAVAGSR